MRHDPAVSRTARIVPLVTTRALREPLDYLQPDGLDLAPGDVVHVPLAGREVRGVVVEAGGPARHQGELALVARLAEEPRIAPAVLELCLWIASYYGSTPARALALALPPRVRAPRETWVSATGVHGATARRRALLELLADGPLPLAELVERAPTTPATVRKLASDGLVALEARLIVPTVSAERTPPPDELTRRPDRRGGRDREAARGRRGRPAAARRDGLGQDGGLPASGGERARARPLGARARARDRALAADGAPLRRALRRAGRRAALGHLRRRAPGRARGRGRRRRAHRRGRALGRLRAAAGRRPDRRRRGARVGLQAGRRPALRRPPRGRQARADRGRRAAARLGHAPPGELAPPAARDAADPRRRRAAARRDRRPAPRRPLPALTAAAQGPDPAGGRGRPRDPAAQPPRRGAGAALPQLRRGLSLRALRRQPRAARRGPAALPPLRLRAAARRASARTAARSSSRASAPAPSA